MKQKIIDNNKQSLKYKIVFENKELAIRPSESLAHDFINSLDKKIQEKCEIIPITNDGLQLLFEN